MLKNDQVRNMQKKVTITNKKFMTTMYIQATKVTWISSDHDKSTCNREQNRHNRSQGWQLGKIGTEGKGVQVGGARRREKIRREKGEMGREEKGERGRKGDGGERGSRRGRKSPPMPSSEG